MSGRISQVAVQVVYANPDLKARVSQLNAQVVYANPDLKARVSDFFVQALWPTNVPRIESLTPDHGLVGDTVTISGASFGASQGAGSVTFGGTAATPSAWSTTSIACTVPAGVSGVVLVVVTIDSGSASLGVPFTAPAPMVGRSFAVMIG